MNFVDFVEKYQQEMAPEQMLAIAKAVGKYLSCKLSDVEEHHVMLERYSKDADEMKEMVVLMAIEYLQDPDCLHPTSKIWHTING